MDMKKVNADLMDQEALVQLESSESTEQWKNRDAKIFATKLEKYAKLSITTVILKHAISILKVTIIEELVKQVMIAMSKEEFQDNQQSQNQHHQQEVK